MRTGLNSKETHFGRKLNQKRNNFNLSNPLERKGVVNTTEIDWSIRPKYANTAKPDQFALYKLNGTTEFDHLNRQYTFVNSFKKGPDVFSIEEVIRSYAMGRFAYRHLHLCLSFAWEDETPEDSIVTKTIEAVRDTQVLVVIGYSFPLFNRDVDRKIIDAMTSLEKVYIQAPDADAMAERFEAVRKPGREITIVLKRDTGQFVFPNEV